MAGDTCQSDVDWRPDQRTIVASQRKDNGGPIIRTLAEYREVEPVGMIKVIRHDYSRGQQVIVFWQGVRTEPRILPPSPPLENSI
jgi:hypothetical protein